MTELLIDRKGNVIDYQKFKKFFFMHESLVWFGLVWFAEKAVVRKL